MKDYLRVVLISFFMGSVVTGGALLFVWLVDWVINAVS